MTSFELPISVDGRLVAADEARVRVDDPAFAWGLSVFDTARVDDGRVGFAERHVRRLCDSCARSGLVRGDSTALTARVRGTLEAYARALPAGAWVVRTTVARGVEHGARPGLDPLAPLAPRVWHVARALEMFDERGVVVSLDPRFTLAGDELDRHKTSSRARHALAREAARALGAFDALLAHVSGDVVEATSANLFACVDGVLVTPPLERGALPGIVRAVLLESSSALGAALVERPLPQADLARASEVFLTNSVHRVVPVRRILWATSIDAPRAPERTGCGPRAEAARAAIRAAERRET